jgi:hypothetical protein
VTTTPNPTAADQCHCACLRVAYDPIDYGNGQKGERWRCPACGSCFNRQGHIDRLTAQLAESERAREALRAELRDIRDMSTDTFAGTSARDALAADQTTARESAENTAEETTDVDAKKEADLKEAIDYVRESVKAGDSVIKALENAVKVFATDEPTQTPEPVEPSDEGALRARLWTHIRNYRAESIGDLAGVAGAIDGILDTLLASCAPKGEPSDAWLEGLYLRNPKGIDYPDNHRESLRRVYRAGLAAEAAAQTEIRRRLIGILDFAPDTGETLGELVDAVALDLNCEWERAQKAEAELERVRAELDEAKRRGFEHDKEWAEKCATLRAQARARRVPSRDECAAEFVRGWRGRAWPGDIDAHERELIRHGLDAVLRLFAEAPPVDEPLVTSDNEPPDGGDGGVIGFRRVPLPGPDSRYFAVTTKQAEARAQQRAAEPTPEAAWNYSAPPDSEIGKMHELLGRCGDVTQFEYSGRFPSPYAPEGEPPRTWWGSATMPATLAMDEEGSVKAWRPASAAPAKGEPLLNVRQWVEEQGSAKPESDSAWLKRTVEELTTARPVEVCEKAFGWQVSAPGCNRFDVAAIVAERNTEWLQRVLHDYSWPLRRNAKPAEPSPQPGGFLDALTRRVGELELQVRALRRIEASNGAYTYAEAEREERERVSPETHSPPAKQ